MTRPITHEVVEAAKMLRAQGQTWSEVGASLGVSSAGLCMAINTGGKGRGRKPSAFTPEVVALILEMRGAGQTHAQIGAALGYSRRSIESVTRDAREAGLIPQRSAAVVVDAALPGGEAVSSSADLAAGPICRVAASLMHHVGSREKAMEQAELHIRRKERRPVAAGRAHLPRRVQSKGPFRIGLHASQNGDGGP